MMKAGVIGILGIKGLRDYGVKVWLKPKAEPDAYGDAGAYGDEVDEDFVDGDDEESGGHGGWMVALLRS